MLQAAQDRVRNVVAGDLRKTRVSGARSTARDTTPVAQIVHVAAHAAHSSMHAASVKHGETWSHFNRRRRGYDGCRTVVAEVSP